MIAIIGGSGLQQISELEIEKKEVIRTPFGIPSAPLIRGTLRGHSVVFLARHGLQHTIPPHLINYRANIWALHHIDCKEILAFSAMCSISPEFEVGQIVIPDQLIDYTWDRKSTFFNSQIDTVHYTEFSEPYSPSSREKLITTAQQHPEGLIDKGTYGVTQGPRYETRAEVKRYQNDGCDLLGMTGMPEAALAQEIGINYAVCGLVTNTNHQDAVRLPSGKSSNDSRRVFEALLLRLFEQ